MSHVIAHPTTLIKAANELQAETIREQQREIADLRGQLATAANRVAKRDRTITELKDAPALISAALRRPDVLAAFRDPRSVVVSVRTEDDQKCAHIGGYALHDSDLEAVVEDRQLFSLFAWCVTVALGQEVVMEERES